MKTTKKFLAVLLAILLLATTTAVSFTASAVGGTDGNITWVFNESTGVLTLNGTGPMNDYDHYEANYTHYDHGSTPWDPYCTSVTTLDIKPGVTSITAYAFACFKNLTSVTIPGSVTSIGDGAFSHCESLPSVTIPSGVTKINHMSFYGCTALTSVTIPNSVTFISSSVFSHCSSLTSVTIPNSVTFIGPGSFSYSGLTSVTIPNSVTSIDDAAFGHCHSLTSVTIPDSVTSIGIYVFEGCDSLTSVTIPDSVTSIANGTFYDCTALTSVTIPGSVTSIGKHAFYNCTALTSVRIPGSVTSIGEYAFYFCTALTDVYYVGQEAQWNNISIDHGNDPLINATRHYACTITASVYPFDYQGTVAVDGIYLPGDTATLTATPINGFAFDGWYNGSTKVSDDSTYTFTVSGDLQLIAKFYDPTVWNFSEGTGVLTVSGPSVMPDYKWGYYDSSTELIFYDAPWGMCMYWDSIKEIVIEPGVTHIGENSFAALIHLKTVSIPDTVTSIGAGAFEECYDLKYVVIPDSVTDIGESAFIECSALSDVYYTGSEAQWNNINIVTGGNSTLINATKHFNYDVSSGDCNFYQIPTEDSDALAEGDYWFDLADFVYYTGLTDEYTPSELYEFQNATYAINYDGDVLRVKFDDRVKDYTRHDPPFMFVLKHGALANDGFHEIPTADSNTLAVGDYWLDWAALAADEGMTPEQAAEELQYLKFYVNADGSTLRLIQYGVRFFDYTAADGSAGYYPYLRQHTGFLPLSTTDSDMLQLGDFWFDLSSFLYYASVTNTYTEAELAAFETATYAIKDDGSTVLVTIDGVTTEYPADTFLTYFVQEHGVDLTEGFTEIPAADSADLAEGAYWFDIAAYIADYNLNPEDVYEELQVTKFYVSGDGATLRVIQVGVRARDYTENSYPGSVNFYPYLRQHGNADVFNPIPTADSDALQNGDKWFDLADFLLYARRMPDMYAAEEVAAFEAATYSLNQAGTVLRVTVDGVDTDYDENSLLILFVQEHGVNLTEGFTEIPTADSADLAEGAYWFDMATYVADAGLDPAQAAEDAQLTKFYVSADGSTLRMIQLNIEAIDFTAANNPNEGGLNLYDYLRPHINANGYTLLPNADSDALNNGDCWFDLNAMLIANTHGLDETDPDYIEIAQKLTKVQIYLKNDGTSMKFFWNGQVVELSPGDDDESGWTYFLRVHGAPQFDGFTLLPTADSADLAAGAYWYDKAAYMDSLTQGMDPADEEEAFVIWMYNAIYGNRSYYLSDDGQTLKVYQNPLSTADIARSDAGSGEYFDFLKQHEGPVEIVDSETDVVISADAGVLPANTVLVVVPDAQVANIEIGNGTLENYSHEAYDVSLKSDGAEIQPLGAVTVKLPIPAGYNKNSIVVYYVDDNGNKTDMHATVEGDYAVFTVNHFSKYVVVDTTCLHNGATETRDARAATCKTDGYSGDTYCLLCGNKIATGAAISKDTVAHTPGTAVKENVVNATTEHGGSYDEVVRCTVCGNVISSTHKTTDPLPQPQPQHGSCKWCGKDHNGNFFQKIIGWFHNIFAKIFGAKY